MRLYKYNIIFIVIRNDDGYIHSHEVNWILLNIRLAIYEIIERFNLRSFVRVCVPFWLILGLSPRTPQNVMDIHFITTTQDVHAACINFAII